MNIIILFFPMIVWFVIVGTIVGVVKANQSKHSRNRRANYGSRPTANRPQMQKDLYERKSSPSKQRKTFFGNSGYDDYNAKGRKKDFVSGYDKRYSTSRSYRQASRTQYTHTYNGHEPWDKCLPKEKDPWDKDFRA